METKIIFLFAFIVLLVDDKNVNATEDHANPNETPKPSPLDPLQNLIFNQNQHNENSKDYRDNTLSRVKRQYNYGRGRYYPLPIIVGGFGFPAFGPGGYGGGGFGGRGFGGRGFGGRGFGGRGFGGRGIGGRGIGGGFGGGRGGGRG